MRAGIIVTVTLQDRLRFEAIVEDRNSWQKHAARARVVIATADGCETTEIMRGSGLSKPVVWQRQEGIDGLLHDKTCKPDKPPLPAETVQRVLDLTLADLPGETTHWSVRAMAKAAGIGAISVQRIWQANGLTPHRMKTFKLSNDPTFAEKFNDVVGLYVDPPAHAVALSIDEKSQIRGSTALRLACR